MRLQLLWLPVVTLLLAGACRGKEERQLAPAPTPTVAKPVGPAVAPPAPVAAATGGKRTFEESCASCHGMDGAGTTPMGRSLQAGNLAAAATHARLSDEQIAETIRKGRGRMPAFPLDEATLKALVAYVRTLNR